MCVRLWYCLVFLPYCASISFQLFSIQPTSSVYCDTRCVHFAFPSKPILVFMCAEKSGALPEAAANVRRHNVNVTKSSYIFQLLAEQLILWQKAHSQSSLKIFLRQLNHWTSKESKEVQKGLDKYTQRPTQLITYLIQRV